MSGALNSVRPYMESHGGNVELLSVHDGVATIHLRGSCSDCAASSVTLELAIKQALEDAAPDLEALEVLGIAPQTAGGPGLPMLSGSPSAAPTGMELPVVMAGVGGSEISQPSWVEVQSVAGLADGAVAAVSVAGSDLVVANVDGTLLAYRDRCANCGATLHEGLLSGGALACPEVPRARSSCPAPGARSMTSTCSWSPCRCCATRGASRSRSPNDRPPSGGRRGGRPATGGPRLRAARAGQAACRAGTRPSPRRRHRGLRPVRCGHFL